MEEQLWKIFDLSVIKALKCCGKYDMLVSLQGAKLRPNAESPYL